MLNTANCSLIQNCVDNFQIFLNIARVCKVEFSSVFIGELQFDTHLLLFLPTDPCDLLQLFREWWQSPVDKVVFRHVGDKIILPECS